ncbi:MAG: AraC family transcriptional regulator, partial [Nocardioidaceae bacterium]
MARIAVVVVDQTPLFHLSVPCEVFGADRSDMGVPRHEVLVVAGEPGRLHLNGLPIQPPYELESILDCDVVIIPWWRHQHDEQPPQRLLDVLRE